MANIKKAATPELEDVFIEQVNSNYLRRKQAREKAAKQRQDELTRMHRNNRRIAIWGTLGAIVVLVAGFATWFI